MFNVSEIKIYFNLGMEEILKMKETESRTREDFCTEHSFLYWKLPKHLCIVGTFLDSKHKGSIKGVQTRIFRTDSGNFSTPLGYH
jgi:hypothetical protein